MTSIVRVIISPKTQIVVNALLLVVFVGLIAPTLLWWSDSIPYIAYLSVYAVIAAHWSALVAALSWSSSKHVEDGDGGGGS